MKQIDGADLQAITQRAIELHKNKKLIMVQDTIEAKIVELEAAEKKVVNAERDLEKAKAKRGNLYMFIDAVRNGNWEAITLDDMNPNQQLMTAEERPQRRES